ncbi:CDP-alcohol phosphatidyltransferase family protein [Puia sp. P3]|uniref:CDP-alcohol phosphatidyltransferase family protein n=1 Tax=Puia sp. P3 TaxID=3423952 RepID=UPI003D67CC86
MAKRAYYLVNGITVYRIIAVFALIILIVQHHWHVFRWLLLLSFLTDALDGFLARRYGVISKAGAVLDSIGDDLTVAVATIALLVFDPTFFRKQLVIIVILVSLYLIQTVAALIRYRKLTSFHTWLAKIAAVSQGVFLVGLFFTANFPALLFYLAAVCTGLDLLEETVMVFMLQHWEADVKGIFFIRKGK